MATKREWNRKRTRQRRKMKIFQSMVKWVSSLAVTVLFVGIVGILINYFYQNHALFIKNARALQSQWQKDASNGLPKQQVAILEKRLEQLKSKKIGPFSATWLTTKDRLKKQELQLEQETQKSWTTAIAQEKKKAINVLNKLENLEGSYFKKSVYQNELKKASTPKDFDDLAKKWFNEAKKWESDKTKLKQLSGGLTSGLPKDVVSLRNQLLQLLNNNHKDAVGEKMRSETSKYLNEPPSEQIVNHSTIIQHLNKEIATLKQEQALALFAKEGIFDSNFKKFVTSREGDVSIAVYDSKNEKTYLYNSGQLYDTASIVKVTIMSDLLYQSQVTGQSLTPTEESLMKPMIEISSNTAASQLWNLAGSADGIQRFLNIVGMTHTTPGTAGQWGLTQTTALDQIKLLKLLAFPNDILNQTSRDYALNLMENVTPWENWGVSSGVSDATVALKNGWLPYPKTWWVNSIGIIKGNGRNYVIAILSKDNPSEQYGIQTDDAISQLVWNKLGI